MRTTTLAAAALTSAGLVSAGQSLNWAVKKRATVTDPTTLDATYDYVIVGYVQNSFLPRFPCGFYESRQFVVVY
jgi:hypothetical protein